MVSLIVHQMQCTTMHASCATQSLLLQQKPRAAVCCVVCVISTEAIHINMALNSRTMITSGSNPFTKVLFTVCTVPWWVQLSTVSKHKELIHLANIAFTLNTAYVTDCTAFKTYYFTPLRLYIYVNTCCVCFRHCCKVLQHITLLQVAALIIIHQLTV